MALVKRKDDETRGEDHTEKTVDDAVSAQQDRMGLIVAAIDDMDANDNDLWIGSGAPDINALEEASGIEDITATERDEAWETYNG